MITDEVKKDKANGFPVIEAIARDVMNNRILKAKLEIPPRIRDEPKSTLNISTTKDGSLKINISKKITEEVEI